MRNMVDEKIFSERTTLVESPYLSALMKSHSVVPKHKNIQNVSTRVDVLWKSQLFSSHMT